MDQLNVYCCDGGCFTGMVPRYMSGEMENMFNERDQCCETNTKASKCVGEVYIEITERDSVFSQRITSSVNTVGMNCSGAINVQINGTCSVNGDDKSCGAPGGVDRVRQVQDKKHHDDSQNADFNVVKFKDCMQVDTLNDNIECNSDSKLAHTKTGERGVNMIKSDGEGYVMGNKQFMFQNGSKVVKYSNGIEGLLEFRDSISNVLMVKIMISALIDLSLIFKVFSPCSAMCASIR